MDMYPINIENAYNVKKQPNFKKGQKSWTAILQKKIWMYPLGGVGFPWWLSQ